MSFRTVWMVDRESSGRIRQSRTIAKAKPSQPFSPTVWIAVASKVGATTLRYAAGGVTVSDGPSLHAITSRRWNGLLAGKMFDRLVRPALRATG
ncbi:hypothetical protein [uncultured Sphingomonas sp.]|uniref:hypothetical protein n=1 Tax=uncultured Sphingomonas sp. TaxID=158754 RepID=UPI0025FB856B|nr:hypothetical protein [uncultured Sphingomonas sp.]